MELFRVKKTFLCEKCNKSISIKYFNKHKAIHEKIESLNWVEIQNFYDDKHTYRDVQKKYKFDSSFLSFCIKLGFLKTRSRLETMLLRKTLKTPKMTPLLKKKISDGMRKAVLEGRQKTLKPYGTKLKIYHHESWLKNTEILHGGWELKIAKYMDSKKIHWIKSKKHFTYVFENKEHEYFPDFYLKDYDLYIEVKGYTQPKDIEKWKQFKHRLLIIDKKNINDLVLFFENLK